MPQGKSKHEMPRFERKTNRRTAFGREIWQVAQGRGEIEDRNEEIPKLEKRGRFRKCEAKIDSKNAKKLKRKIRRIWRVKKISSCARKKTK